MSTIFSLGSLALRFTLANAPTHLLRRVRYVSCSNLVWNENIPALMHPLRRACHSHFTKPMSFSDIMRHQDVILWRQRRHDAPYEPLLMTLKSFSFKQLPKRTGHVSLSFPIESLVFTSHFDKMTTLLSHDFVGSKIPTVCTYFKVNVKNGRYVYLNSVTFKIFNHT